MTVHLNTVPTNVAYSRNILVTGDDFTQQACQSGNDPSNYCVCDQGAQRTVCTVGLHTIMAGSRDHSNDTSLSPLLRSNGAYTGGLLKIQNTLLEKCGQRGMKGR